MGFSELMIIAVIAVLFLGPDKLPSAMVDIAKFFRNAKKTINTVKDSIEQEINVSEIKQEALAYKKELMETSSKVRDATDITDVSATLANLSDDIIKDIEDEPEVQKPKKTTSEKKKERRR
jgi:sec-independent protein translocase protein TatB